MSQPNILSPNEHNSGGHKELWGRLDTMFNELGSLAATEVVMTPAGNIRSTQQRVVDEPRLSVHGRILHISQVVHGSSTTTARYQISVRGETSPIPDISYCYLPEKGYAVAWDGEQLPVDSAHYEVINTLLVNSDPRPLPLSE